MEKKKQDDGKDHGKRKRVKEDDHGK